MPDPNADGREALAPGVAASAKVPKRQHFNGDEANENRDSEPEHFTIERHFLASLAMPEHPNGTTPRMEGII
jgi:hypothetical protein